MAIILRQTKFPAKILIFVFLVSLRKTIYFATTVFVMTIFGDGRRGYPTLRTQRGLPAIIPGGRATPRLITGDWTPTLKQ